MPFSRARRSWWGLALAIPIVVSLAVPANIVGQTSEATFVERRNQVEYSPAGSAQWQPAPADVALAPGDRIRTAANSTARVAFGDGSTAALAATTGLRVDQLDASGDRLIRLTQTSGITQAQVQPGDGGRYEVATPAGVASAPAGSCPWVRVGADGAVLVRNYGNGAPPAVEPQMVQEVVYLPSAVPGPGGPVPVPMPQVVSVWKEMPPSAAPEDQPLVRCAGGDEASRDLSVRGDAGNDVALPPGHEAELRPGQPPTAPAPIGTAAARAAARAASAQAVQQAGMAGQQAGAVAAGAQAQAASAAIAGASAAFNTILHATRLNDLLRTLTPTTAPAAPTPAPAPAPAPAAAPPPQIFPGGACAAVVGGLCNVAGTGFFGQCTRIGSVSCSVTINIPAAGVASVAASSPRVQFATTTGSESIACQQGAPGSLTLTCVGTLNGDPVQNGPVTVAYAPGTVIAGAISAATASDLREPAVRASLNGRLDTTFAARYGPVNVAGSTVLAETYESSYPGPTLRFRGGDTVRVRLDNQLPTAPFAAPPDLKRDRRVVHDVHQSPLNITNLHVHGLHVSPEANSDNVFLMINPGQSFQYEYRVPSDHPPGLYWYHPHHHGLTEQQTGFGMMGAIIIEGALDRLPGIAGLRERLLVMHVIQVAGGVVVPGDQQDPNQILRTINGQVNPTIRIQPGETQRWRISNAAADDFFRIKLDGHPLHQIASDGNTWRETTAQEDIVMGPGERVEVLVQCRNPGNSIFRTIAFNGEPDVPMATVVCEGPRWTPQPLPTTLIPFLDLRSQPVARTRTVAFVEQNTPDGGVLFMIDSGNGLGPQLFDPNRVDIQVKLNTVEEWIITNPSPDLHPFHIHVNDFQVTGISGSATGAIVFTPVDVKGGDDTYPIPIGGAFRMRTLFKDFVGKFVIHCHILQHEDAGMMAVVEVIP